MIRLSIPSSQMRVEMCSCQCPISGSIPIIYNKRQQSCTIGSMQKPPDRRFTDDGIDHYL